VEWRAVSEGAGNHERMTYAKHNRNQLCVSNNKGAIPVVFRVNGGVARQQHLHGSHVASLCRIMNAVFGSNLRTSKA
jgi:hypothetical protein